MEKEECRKHTKETTNNEVTLVEEMLVACIRRAGCMFSPEQVFVQNFAPLSICLTAAAAHMLSRTPSSPPQTSIALSTIALAGHTSQSRCFLSAIDLANRRASLMPE